LRGLKSLKVDTGDQEIDEMFYGYIRVVAGYNEEHVVRVEEPISVHVLNGNSNAN